MLSLVRLSSVCLSSVSFVHPTQPREIFGSVSAPFRTLVIKVRKRYVQKRMRLPKGCKIFGLKFDCEIQRGVGKVKVYTFGMLFQWTMLRISKWNRKCGALPVGYNFVALVAVIILFKNTM